MTVLVEAIYDAAMDPGGWSEVGRLLKGRFHSSVEAFYRLEYGSGGFHEIHVAGVDAPYYRSFPEHFFSADNPFVRSEPLHRPGVIRTDEMVQKFFRDTSVVRRSRYYNEWLRPQELAHTLGTTLSADGGGVANLSLLRPARVGPFSRREVGDFRRLAVHLRRAARIARRLESLGAREQANLDALDALSHGALFLDLRGRLLYGNRAAEAIVRRGEVLAVRDGRLEAVAPRDRGRLASLLARLARGPDLGADPAGFALGAPPCCLQLVAVRLSAAPRRFADSGPCLFLLLVDPDAQRMSHVERWRRRYRLTPGELDLVAALVAGESLRQAAQRLGISYETARWYLKIVFQKTDTGRQGELVARLLSEPDPPA